MKDDAESPEAYWSLVEMKPGAAVLVDEVPADTELTVRTASGSEYELYVLDPEARSVMISGGVFGAHHVVATVRGSVLGPDVGPLHCGWIKVGYSLEITFDSATYSRLHPPVCTSPVVEILKNDVKVEPRKPAS